MRSAALAFFSFSFLLLGGCCGLVSPPSSSSGSCSLGTYGSACTNFCDKSQGTQFATSGDCFTECMDLVRQQGFGDATTCCKESMNSICQRTCSNMISGLVQKYGQDAMADSEEEMAQCLGECNGMYDALGIPLSSCGLVDPSQAINSVNSGY